MHQTDSTRRSAGPLVAVAATLSLILAACSGGTATTPTTAHTAAATPSAAATQSAAAGTSTTASGEAAVMLASFAFSPATLSVPVGTKVTFMNMDATEHTATNGKNGTKADNALFDLTLKAGASDSFTFDKAGTYDVTCRIHPGMHMTITVG